MMQKHGRHGGRLLRLAPICLACGVNCVAVPVWANPTGPAVVSGSVSFARPDAGTLNITNTPGAIIRWQGFSIAPGEVTRFIQQSASSAVLNRVVGGNISEIFGSLVSNGQVYLINPSGILIGKGAVVDTAGFVASSLNLRNSDFLAGKLNFRGSRRSGDVVNEGLVRTTPGGMVLLLAPDIENSGVIETPEGEILLAAGRRINITSLDAEGVQFVIQSPADSVTNIGRLVADGGAIGVFAGTLNNSGVVQANALARDQAGRIVLAARNKLNIADAGSITANGAQGGDITLKSGSQVRVEGSISARGDDGAGGSIRMLGRQVALAGNASMDASGTSGGGTILVGGDYQGANPDVTNAVKTYVGPGVMLTADALASGDGGRVIVWADQLTRYFGNLSARGGANGGNGGFAEISGKRRLVMDGGADLGAPAGALGTLLLDPLDLFVDDRGGELASLTNELTDVPLNVATVSPATLAAINGNVDLRATRDLYFLSDVNLTTAGQGLTAQAGDDVLVNASIATNAGALALTAGDGFSFVTGGAHTLATAGGAITLTATTGQLNLPNVSLDAGSGAVNITAPQGIFTSDVAGGVVGLASSGGTVDTDNLTSNGSLTLNGSNVQAIAINTNGGALSATASNGHFIASGTIDTRPAQTGAIGGTVTIAADDSNGNFGSGFVDTRGINAGNANVSLSGEFVDTSGQAIDTTGNVTLTAIHNDTFANASITARVNNAASVVATADRQSASNANSAIINIGSDTILNATTVAASTSGCSFFGSCGGANITLSGAQGVNVGTVTATAPVSFNNTFSFGAAYADPRYENINETVNISSSTGSVLAMSGTSQITAADVTLSTIPSGNAATGGDIGATGTALRVDAERNLVFKAGGDFNLQLLNDGPSRLDIQLGVAPAGQGWNGTLSGSGHNGVTLSASADDSTVTVSNFSLTGFDQRVYNQGPSASLYTPNGNLAVTSVSLPRGDNTGSYTPSTRFTSAQFFPADVCVNGTASCTYRNSGTGLTTTTVNASFEPMTFTARASGDLDVDSYVRAGTLSDQAKNAVFQSDDASVTLATITGNRDAISIVADTGIALTDDLATGGNVSIVNNFSGSVSISSIDTTDGTGSVSITANGSTVAVGAALDSGALEVNAGGAVTITANTIGSSGFANPLDITGPAVTLSRPSGSANAGAFGFAGAPIIANTQVLTINAASTSGFTPVGGSTFNISTGSSALKTLNVTADPLFVGSGGLAQVRTEAGGANDKTYIFASDGANFSFNPGAIPATQFVNGQLNFTSTSGNIDLPADLDLGSTGSLVLTAQRGSISTLDLDAATVTLRAEPSYLGAFTATQVSITTGDIGSINRPDTLTIQSGNYYRPGYVETGTIEANTVTIDSYGLPPVETNSIMVGNIGATTRAGAVSLTANNNWQGGAGDIQTGNIVADSIDLFTGYFYATGAVFAGNLDATSGITAYSDLSISTGTLDAETINLGAAYCCYPSITTGAIGGTTAPNSVNITGSTVTIDGAVTGDSTAEDTINLYANGLLTVNGAITGGDGSTITLNSNGGATEEFQFSQINAGATGTVSITSANGILQTSSVGGITAENVTLSAASTTNGNISQAINGDSDLDLFGVKNLTIVVGDSAELDANGGTLESLSITMHADCPDCSQFTLSNLGGSQTLDVFDGGGSDFHVELNSTSLLDFSFNATATGIQTSGGGIITSGGDVTLNSADVFDGTVGGITTSGGGVTISTAGAVDTGAIATAGGNIAVTTNAGNSDIVVDGNLTAGSGTISLAAQGADSYIERSGGSVISSSASVSLTAADGSIGTSGTPMLITAPSVTLDARDPFNDLAQGYVFATLTGTNALTLRGDNGFNVSSDTAFSTLSLSTLGSGAGTPGSSTLDLAASGQSYSFDRPSTDLFANFIADTFEVGSVTGTPLTSATFRALDGDLLVRGGTTINASTLNLLLTSGGINSIKLQGNAANPLSLSNTTQNIAAAGAHLSAAGKVTLSANDQTLSADVSIHLDGGSADNENVTVTATGNQLFNAGQDIDMFAGAGNNSSILVQHSGSGNQTLRANGRIGMLARGSATTTATFMIENLAGTQDLDAEGAILLIGGLGTDATARIVNSGSGNQLIGNTFDCCGEGRLYTTNSITVEGGSGTGAYAAVESTATGGSLQVFESSGLLKFQGGTGDAATASASTVGTQLLGRSNFCCDGGTPLGGLSLLGGTGTGAYALVTTTATQNVFSNGNILLQGGNATSAQGTDAYAALTANSQTFAYGNFTLGGGTESGNYARMQSTTSQFFDTGNISLTGGAAANTAALISAAGSQSFSFPAAVTLTGGSGSEARIESTGSTQAFTGLSSLTMAGGATGAVIQAAGSQSFSGGGITLTGGSGSGARIVSPVGQTFSNGTISLTGGTAAGAVASITAPSQAISSSGSLNVTSGAADATVAASGTGLQTVSASGGIAVKSQGAGAAILSSGGAQTLTASSGGVVLAAEGAGNATASAAGIQTVNARYVDVTTKAATGTGNALLSATGNQSIITTNGTTGPAGSLHVAALGSGTASVTSGGDQTIELDYPNLMYDASRDGTLRIGDAAAQGVSTLTAAGDQTIIAREIFIEGGSATGASAKLNADGAQVISTLLGGISIAGGAGNGASASLDPTSQSIVTNGDLLISGGSGTGATGFISSTGQQFIAATNGDIVLTGGAGSSASTSITTSFTSLTLMTSGLIDLIPGTGADADAFISAGNGFGFVNLFCVAGCTFTTLFSNPVGNGSADAGVFTFPLGGNTFDVTEFLGDGYLLDWYLTNGGTQDEYPPGRTRICQ